MDYDRDGLPVAVTVGGADTVTGVTEKSLDVVRYLREEIAGIRLAVDAVEHTASVRVDETA